MYSTYLFTYIYIVCNGREFEAVLKAIKWPFVNTLSTTPPPDALHQFQLLTEFLLQLQLPYPSQR